MTTYYSKKIISYQLKAFNFFTSRLERKSDLGGTKLSHETSQDIQSRQK